MNPHIGDMRRAREFRDAFIANYKNPMKRKIVPELRSIPLTWLDCEYFDSPLCRWDGKDPFKYVNLNGWLCSMLRGNGYCPRGFP